MNAVEIEEAVSELAAQPFDAEEFPFAFLTAFGNKGTTVKRLRSASSNSSDVPGGVLQQKNIHIATCALGTVGATLKALRASPKTASLKARFILATDGVTLEAEDLTTGETVACDYTDFPNHFGFFLALAGITTVKQLRENAFDIRATGRLNRLYLELRKHNPDWDKPERRHDMNHFMARLIFCFFAESTDIFFGEGLFTATIDQMSERDASNMHEVIGTIFRAMNTRTNERAKWNCPRWADAFPYVNGGLFSGELDVPRFTRIARSYLVHIGGLDWKKINPDIFGSMIQAVADDEERGALGMHYTSVPNILKVLNPLFLDELRARLDEADDNGRTLLNLRKRIARIRVFDPACGSGNFLVIAYKHMREIEAEINRRRGEPDRRTDISLKSFRGIELRDFPAEIARLALIIAEYQCDVLYRGQKDALRDFLPLDAQNWIVCDNALRLDWMSVCPPTGTGVKLRADDLFGTPLEQAQIDFENEGGETYICGNPQFKGARRQSKKQKDDLSTLFKGHIDHKDCDYVVGWFLKAAQYTSALDAPFAFVATNSIAQGEQVAHLWTRLFELNLQILFAHRTFLWRNNAENNAGVHCVVIGVNKRSSSNKHIYEDGMVREVRSISPYLIPGDESFVEAAIRPISEELPAMNSGNMARDGGHLILSADDANTLLAEAGTSASFIKRLVGTKEINQGEYRYCLWIEDRQVDEVIRIRPIASRVDAVRQFRSSSAAKTTNAYARIPHKFAQRCHKNEPSIAVPKTTTGESTYITPQIYGSKTVITDLAFVVYPMDLVTFSVISSALHLIWVKTVAGGMRDGLRYSSQLAYHTFPLPKLTQNSRVALIECAKNILLIREAHFPKTIADLYNRETMPNDLRGAHERNDEVLERIYIGRKFKNDTERLEKLFDLYSKMIATEGGKAVKGKAAKKAKAVS
jgi:hypothetical protein